MIRNCFPICLSTPWTRYLSNSDQPIMIKSVIFDLGNVLINFKPKEFLLRYTQDKERINAFFSKIIWSERWWALDKGTYSIEEARSYFQSKYPEEKDLIEPYFENWLESLTPIVKNIQMVKELKQEGYKVYVLSNFIKEAFSYITKKYEFLSLFDGKVISSEEKVIKPEKEIYAIILNRYDLIPGECVFLDDHEFILEPAKELGMHTILVAPEVDIRAELRNLGVTI